MWSDERLKVARRCGAKHIYLQVKKLKTPHVWKTFRSCDVEKVHPLWCEAHFEAKCTKRLMFGPLLEVEMSKKCTPLWCEAHFQVTSVKN
jgi:hypothetical protein